MAELKLENSIVDERYSIDRCLGRGSYAEIFLAYDQKQDDTPVIIKALNPTLQGTPDTDLERTLVENFQNEANALDRVRHPHIIRRLGHGTAIDLSGKVFHYLVLEYMAGGDLHSLCNKKALGLNEALIYFEQIAEALAFAHAQNVIHRDIKPKNLLLSADHTIIKICDFGVAKMTGQNCDDEITRVGTDVYAPPEHHPDSDDVSDEKLTPSADIYSLAKTIYTAMTGRAPRGFSRKPLTSLPAELLTQKWGAALLKVLHRATATRVAERYANVDEFWKDFAALDNLIAEVEEEKTHVSSRLQATSNIERPTAVPNFPAVATTSGRLHKQARIVVDIPSRSREPEVESPPSQAAHQMPPVPQTNGQTAVAAPAGHAVQNRVVQPGTLAQSAKDSIKRPRLQPEPRLERNAFDKVRSKIKVDWMLRIFILFLVLTVIGLASSVYFRFSGQSDAPPIMNWFNDKDGEISGADFVKLRAEAKGKILRWLPRGTKIRRLEERDGWVRVRVTYVPPITLPADAPTDNLSADSGWISSKLIDF